MMLQREIRKSYGEGFNSNNFNNSDFMPQETAEPRFIFFLINESIPAFQTWAKF